MATLLERALEANRRGIPQNQWPQNMLDVYNEANKRGIIVPEATYEKPPTVSFTQLVDPSKPIAQQIPLGYGEMKAFGFEETKAEALRKAGIETEEGAPVEARAAVSYARNKQEALDAVERILQSKFGTNARVSIEPSTGEVIYYNPQKEQWSSFDPAGPDWGDISDLQGEWAPILGGISGALAGAGFGSAAGPTGTVVGGFTGEMVGTAAGEFLRLKEGQKRGVVPADVSDTELALDAAIVGGLDALAGPALNMALRSMVSTPGLSKFDIDMSDLAERMRLRKSVHEEVGTKPTTGQLMRGTPEGDELLTAEVQIGQEASKAGKMFRQHFRDNMTAAERYYLDITGGRADIDQEALGRSIQGKIAEFHQSVILDPEDSLVTKYQGQLLDSVFGDGMPRRVRGENIGGEIRKTFRETIENFENVADAKYGMIRDAANELPPIRPDTLVSLQRDLSKMFRSDIFKSLQESSKKLVDDLRGLQRTVTQVDPTTGKEVKVKVTRLLNYRQISRGLSALRRLERNIDLGLTPDTDIAIVRKLRSELTEVRNEFLSQDPGLLEYTLKTDVWYAGQKELYDRSLIGRLLKTQRGGRAELIVDEDVFNEIFTSNRQSIQNVYNILSEPQNANTLMKFRGSIINEWKKSVQWQEGDVVNTQAHREFTGKFRDVMDVFLTPEMRRNMDNSALFAKRLEEQINRRNRIAKELGKEFEGRVINLESADKVFGYTWNNPARTRKTVSLIKSDKELFNSYKSLATEDMYIGMTGITSEGRMLQSDRIRRYLEGTPDRPGKARQIKEIWGNEAVERLLVLADALDDINAMPLRTARVSGRVRAIYDLTRAYVGLFTTPGRFVTAYRKIAGRAEGERIARMLIDPEFLMKAKKSPRNRVIRGMLADAGAYHMLFAPSLEPPEPEYTEIRGLQP